MALSFTPLLAAVPAVAIASGLIRVVLHNLAGIQEVHPVRCFRTTPRSANFAVLAE